MNDNAGPVMWAMGLMIAIVFTALQILLALDKWGGAKPYFVKSTRKAAAAGATISFVFAVLCLLGLLQSL